MLAAHDCMAHGMQFGARYTVSYRYISHTLHGACRVGIALVGIALFYSETTGCAYRTQVERGACSKELSALKECFFKAVSLWDRSITPLAGRMLT